MITRTDGGASYVKDMDPYQLLGVPRNADDEMLRKAYLRHARIHHPDRGGCHAAMVAINKAYAVLSDPGLRAQCDRILLQYREGGAAHGSRRPNGRIVLRPSPRFW